MGKRKFQHVGVIMGGSSAEREVSLKSGAAVARGLRTAGYEVTEIIINSADLVIPSGIEAVFIALHGAFGEDGSIQKILQKLKIPYTGAGPTASLACFDKALTKEILAKSGLPFPAYEILRKPTQKTSLPCPIVTKPARQGSSIGVQRVFKESDWDSAIEETFKYDDQAIIEQFVYGKELTIGIVDDEVLPVIEIRAPAGRFFDYEAKYTQGLSEEIVPAPLSQEKTQECKNLALAAYKALGCRGLSRIDMIMDAAGKFFILENNTIPGFTDTSLLPKAAQAAGISFPALCDRIMSAASV